MVEALSRSSSETPASRRPKILLVLASFYPDIFGGAERQGQILAQALKRLDVHVTIVAPTVSAASSVEETDYARIVRFRVRDYPNFGGRRFGSTLKWIINVGRWAITHRSEFDIVYVFHARLHSLAGLAAARLADKPLLIKAGGSGDGFDLNILLAKKAGYGRLVVALLTRMTDGFVANSSAIAEDFAQFNVRGRVFVFPNGVVIPPRDTIERAFAGRRGNRYIFAGRIDHEKNIETIVEAVGFCRDAGAHVEFTFAGAGPALDDVRRKADALNLLDRVRFIGRTDEIYPQLLAHDFFVSASTREGQSNALLEAMATACIPIVANVSGAPDVVSTGRNGFIVEEASPQAFGKVMLHAARLAASERTELGWAAHEFARTGLDIDLIARRTLEAANELISSRGGIARGERRAGSAGL